MFRRDRLAGAVASALAASLTSGTAHGAIEEVVVTATKRTASTQDVPVTVTALSTDALRNRGIRNFDDLVAALPTVTIGGRGPGQAEIYIRGVAADTVSQTVGGAQATVPNVAVYIDEQPTTSPSRLLDLYTIDLERVEVLSGPQGTLFGASAMSGAVRYITNKAKLDTFEGSATAGFADTKSGDMSHTFEGIINIPLIENRLAMRVAAYNNKQGGYIDNVAGTTSVAESIPNNSNLQGVFGPGATFQTASNAALVEENFNDARYRGVRTSVTLAIDDNWTFRGQHIYQDLETDGVFDFDPAVGDLEVERYFDDSLEDVVHQGAWTLNGLLGALDITYAGAYMDRDINQSIDYTGYNNAGAYIPLYTCDSATPRNCLDPVKGAVIDQRINRHTHEFRFSTPQENRVRLTSGVFYDYFKLQTLDLFRYEATDELGFAPNAIISTADPIIAEPGVPQAPGVAFFNDIGRTENQLALFGELSLDLTDSLTVTGGIRYYNFEIDFNGSSNFAQTGTDGDSGRDYDNPLVGHSPEPFEESGFIGKANIEWRVDDEKLLYATWSQGFRPGGWNRAGPPSTPIPVNYSTDSLENYELGWKTSWFDNRLRLNGALFYIDWSEIQLARFDPNITILTFIDNAADAEIYGFESDFSWLATDQLTVDGAISVIETELTEANSDVVTLVPPGSELALAPPVQANLRVRYDWQMGPYLLNVRGGFSYTGQTFSALAVDDRREQDNYIVGNVAAGVEFGKWRADAYVRNISDTRAELFFNTADDVPRITTNRPRTIGMTVSYVFE